jgi:hypothetical protein
MRVASVGQDFAPPATGEMPTITHPGRFGVEAVDESREDGLNLAAQVE